MARLSVAGCGHCSKTEVYEPAAEQALPKCGFRLQYDPTITGSIESVARRLQSMA